MKKLISIFVIAVIIGAMCIFVPTGSLLIAEAETFSEGDYTYTVSNGEAIITGYIGAGGDIIIPSTIAGLSVTVIGDEAFNNQRTITSVSIPDTVTTIGAKAFYNCRGLLEVVIPDSVLTIGDEAFRICNSAKSLSIGSGVINVGEKVFGRFSSLVDLFVSSENTALKVENGCLIDIAKKTVLIGIQQETVVIPDGVEHIGDYAFYGPGVCQGNLKTIIISSGVKTVGDQAFDCTMLSTLVIPKTVTTFGNTVSSNTPLHSTHASKYNVPLGNVYYEGTEEEYQAITMGSSNNSLKANIHATKHYNSCIKSSKIDYTHEYDELDICKNCGLHRLFKYKVNDDGETITIIGCVGSSEEVVIPSTIEGYSVSTIGNSVFYDCDTLVNVVIPDSVTTIGDSAFYGCDNLVSVVMGNNVSVIDHRAFAYCYNLAGVVIPDSVTTIGAGAFICCSSLESIVIPESVTTIGDSAFFGGFNLENFVVGSNNPNYASQDGVLFNKNKTILIQYPAGKTSTIYTIPDSVTIIGAAAFDSSNNLVNVVIPDSVTTIGSGAFSLCLKLESVVIPDSVTTISGSTFSGCVGLKSVVIGSNVTTIGMGAFYYCESLVNVVIPDSVTLIDWQAFAYCYSLTKVVIPDSVATIGWQAFFECESLKDVWYEGESQNNIVIVGENDYLTSATWHYNSCMENNETYEHIYEWVVDVESTCNATGIKHEECTLCQAKQNENTVIAVTDEHTYDDANDVDCNVCGQEREPYIHGDLDEDEGVTDSDAVYLLFHTYFPEDYPIIQDCDFDGDGYVTDSDAVYLLFHTYFPEDYPLA